MHSKSAPWYDLFYAQKDYGGESAAIAALIRRHVPDATTLLDVACGTGRHLEHLQEWFDCEGLDLDEGLLHIARSRLPRLPLSCGDMRDLQLGRRFDAITCLFSAIGYLQSLHELQAALCSMAAHLAPGGVLVVEPWLLPGMWGGSRTWADVVRDGERTLVRVGSGRQEGRMTILRFHYVVAEKDRDIVAADEEHRLRLFSAEEYLTACTGAGLEATWDCKGLTGRGLLIGKVPGGKAPGGKAPGTRQGVVDQAAGLHGVAPVP